MSLGAEIRARMSLDSAGMKAGVAQAEKHVDKFSTTLKHVAGSLGIAFGAGAIIQSLRNFSKQAIESAVQASHFSKQVNLSTDQFQAFRAEAMLMTGGLNAAQTGLVRFRTAQDEALEGNEKTINAFERLGLTLEHIADYSTADLLEAVAKGYREIGDFGALVDLFGSRNAAKLEQALIALADNGFDQLTAKAKASGQVISEDVTAKIAQASDELDKFKLKMKGWGAEKLILVTDQFRGTASIFDGFNAGMGKIVEQSKGPVVSDGNKKPIGERFKGFFSDMWSPFSAFGGKFKTRADLEYDDKIAAQKRKEEQARQEEISKKLRAGKIADIYAQEEEAALKVEGKRAAVAEREAEKKRIADLRAAGKQVEAEEGSRFRESQAADMQPKKGGGAWFHDLRAAKAAGTVFQYDSLRKIGANILGSGVISTSQTDRQAELISVNQKTADNTARIAKKLEEPPIHRLSDSMSVY
jgi:hypothetical protein